MTAPNILLLDEPTNDLDIDTLMVLEDYIENFPGAVVLISHDRYFLDKTTDHILEFQGQGRVKKYLGGYSDYLNERPAQVAPTPKKAENKKPEKQPSAKRPGKTRFSFNEQREYETIDEVIAKLEEEKAQVDQAIVQSASDYEELQRLMALQAQLEEQLNEKSDRWLYLNNIADIIAEESK